MAFDIPTLDDELEFEVAHLRYLFPNADVSDGSPNWLALKTFAAGVTNNHAHIAAVENDLLPDTALGPELVRWGVIIGVIQKGATVARGSKVLRVFGTIGTTVPNAQALTYEPSGLQFATASSQNIGAGGYVDVDIVSIDTGSATLLSEGSQLNFQATPAGLVETCVLQATLVDGGDDIEQDGPYKSRQLLKWSSPPLGGAATDYVQWALATNGIAQAYCYPIRAGVGTVDLVGLHEGSGADRVMLAGEITALQAAITALRPVAVKAFRVLTVTTFVVNIEYTTLPNGALQYEYDWDDTTPPTVLAYTAGTRTLQFAGGARPPSLQAGHRMTVNPISGTGGTGKQLVVESFTGADSVIVENDPTADVPAVGDTIYAGGPLVDPTRAALQALVDSLGPANPDDKNYGAWEGNLDPGALDTAARAVVGGKRGTGVRPADLVVADDPAYPDDGTVQLLIAGRILVHRQH